MTLQPRAGRAIPAPNDHEKIHHQTTMKKSIIKNAFESVISMIKNARIELMQDFANAWKNYVIICSMDKGEDELSQACLQIESPVLNLPKTPEFWMSTWGWEQTNVDFYVVIKKTESTIWLQKVCHGERTNAGHDMQTYCKPSSIAAPGSKVLRRKIKRSSFDNEEFVSVNSYAIACPWTGKAILETSYA